MDKLDHLVSERLADQLLTPERVEKILSLLLQRQTSREEDYALRLTDLKRKLADAEARLGRLYQAIESGIADPSDATLKDRLAAIKTERDIAQAAFDRAVSEMHPGARITAEKIAAFTDVMRTNVLTGDVAFRRASSRVSSLARQLGMDAFPPDSRYHWGVRTTGRVP
jgi:site-specific DNA recombinase